MKDQRDTTVTPLGACSHIKNGKKEDLGNYELVSLNSVPGKTGQHILLAAMSKHMKDKKITRSSQQGFSKGHLHLTNLITFYNETTACVDNRRALDVVLIDCSIDFIKAFDMVSHSLLVGKLVRFGLDKWSMK
ncbi:mitochondrial enolase superfamily member 1 [Grus japonensis]|uniref:Mitochondrial enolase superfamily member 1 n=1 Tax=Grus japonensis TaxID=30415 RepID=A0ABC9XRL7_GRUJA